MGTKYIFKLTIAAAFLAQAFAIQAVPPPLPQQGQSQMQMPMGQAGPAPQKVSTTNSTVQKAAKYAANELKSGSVAKVLAAERQGKDGEIYVMQVQMTNGKVYQVEVCAPTDKPWKLQDSIQLR